MRFLYLSIVLSVLLSTVNISAQTFKNNMMPVPREISAKEGKFRVMKSFSMSIKGDPDARLYGAATRMLRRLSGRTGLFFVQDYITGTSNTDTTSLIIICKRKGQVKLGEDESYSLEVSPAKILVNAETDLGAMKALETVLQLLDSDSEGYFIPAVSIKDYPRFKWRGLMMDVSRHFMPLEVIYRNLDAMAAVKLNVFHWHLSDDQGFRVECKSLPLLHQKASDGLYYTQEQVKQVIAYAHDRGIRVVPEFDVPGHSTSWLTAYPELASAPGPYTIERNWGVFDPTFNPTIEKTYEFFDKFLKEMTALFDDEYFHIGGDENNGKQWSSNEQIKSFMKKNNIADNHALQAYFNNRLLKLLTKYNKKMIGWDEILHPDMPKTIVIQSWRGPKGLNEAAQKGYQALLSNGYYIDLIQPTDFHYLNDPLPADNPLTPEQRKFILGGEATQWAELVTPENVDSRIWPRMAAIAERFWSDQSVRDIPDMYRRMDIISLQLEELGIMHIKNQEMMLRRLVKGENTAALKTLVDVLEPVKLYSRHSQGVKYRQHSPYTRVVDAALPDQKTSRKFNNLANGSKNSRDMEEMRIMLLTWKENHTKLKPVIAASPVLKEIETISEDLAAVSDIGLQALELISQNKKADSKWVDESLEMIKKAKTPRGQTELMITSGIENLVKAVQP